MLQASQEDIISLPDHYIKTSSMGDTVQLTGNVAGTRTTRHASTQETREGTGSPRGIASKTTRELNYSQFTRETSLKAIMIQPVHKIHAIEHSDMQLQHSYLYLILMIIHAVTRRSCAGHVSIGALRGVLLWHSRVPAGDVTCELYCTECNKIQNIVCCTKNYRSITGIYYRNLEPFSLQFSMYNTLCFSKKFH